MRIAVLGGGISGLAAAWNLSRAAGGRPGAEVLLLEASTRVGGWVESERAEKGAVFELGPRSLRTAGVSGENTLRLVSESLACLAAYHGKSEPNLLTLAARSHHETNYLQLTFHI